MARLGVRGMCSLVAVLAISLTTSQTKAADEAAGEVTFQKYCSICHSVNSGRNKFGPTLAGVVGRKTASVASFSYSEPLAALGKIWTPELLEKWLTEPAALVPGTRMTFPGVKNQTDRDNLIEYLKTQ